MRRAVGSPIHVVATLLAILLTACGGEDAPAETQPEATPASTEDPFAPLPPEQLYGASPVENLWTPRVELEVPALPPGWNGVRIALLSDLQLGLWDQNEAVAAAAVLLALDAQPDAIFLLGDYLAEGADFDALRRVLAPISGKAAFAVLGDRDIRSDSIAAGITEVLRSVGAQVLRNNAVPAVLGGDTAWIAGLDPELLGETGADQEYILSILGPAGRTPVLLAHNVGLAPRAPEGRFPVVVGGNTFCGQVEVPGSPRLSWLREQIFPGAQVEGVDRLFYLEGTTILVTCGVGYGFVPLRFGAAPEVVLLTLVGLGGGTEMTEAPPAMVEDSLIERYQGTAPTDSL